MSLPRWFVSDLGTTMRRRSLLAAGLAVLLFGVGCVPKVVYLLATDPEMSPDERHFVALATTLRESGTLGVAADQPGAIRPPLYPLFLALFPAPSSDRLEVALLVQIVMAALVGPMAAWVAFRLAGPYSAVLAGLLAVSYVPMMKFPARYLTETLAACLLLSSLWIVDRALERDRRSDLLMAGAALALGGLIRAAMFPLVAVAVVMVLMRSGSRRRRLSRMALVMAAFIVVYSPWVVRNCLSIGRCVVLTEQGSSVGSVAYYTAKLVNEGYSLREARREVLYEQGPLPDSLPARARNGGELPMPKSVPIMVRVQHIGQRLAILLGAHPSLDLPFPFAGQRAAEVPVLRRFNYGWTVFMLLGVALCVGVATKRGSLRLFHALALPAALLAIHSIIHAIPRYQVLIFVTWAVAAGVGWGAAAEETASLVGKWRRR